MKKSIKIIVAGLVCLLATACSSAEAQNKKRTEEPYNLRKAYEVLQENGNEEQAIQLLKEQVKTTPDNAECWLLLCRIYSNREDYASALFYVNKAIEVNKPRKSGIYHSSLQWWKADVYSDLGDEFKSLECLKTALAMARKDNPENVQRISFDLGMLYYNLKMYDEGNAIYRTMLKEDEGDQAALTGLARNLIACGNCQRAVELLDRSVALDADYPSQYKIRSQAYDKMGETDKAIDDAIKWYEKDSDAYGSELVKLLMKHSTYSLAKVKKHISDGVEVGQWRLLLIALYEQRGEFEAAIREYDTLEDEFGKNEIIYYQRAKNYDELGLTQKALADIEKAIEMDDNYYYNCRKGQVLRRAGRYSEAITVFEHAIEIDPTDAFAYYAKGWCHELSGDDDAALADYNEGIDIDKQYPYIYLMRGEQYLEKGMIKEAMADFETIVAKDTTAESGSCRQYALHFLGHDEEAIEWMEKIIETCPFDAGELYDYACLLSRMGRHDESVKKLEDAFEKGYCAFHHIEHDNDMDPVRGREDFKALILTYSEKLSERIAKMDTTATELSEERITEVPITRRSGRTFDITCEVNGLALNMVFDTGASDVTISKVEADFMMKNNYLSSNDIKGKRYYQIADGGITDGTVITLKEVKIGDAVLHNVDASVVKSQKAPLLLGESVLQKFGTFTVDNIHSKLIIRH